MMSEPSKAGMQTSVIGSGISGVVGDDTPSRQLLDGRPDRRRPLPFKLTIVVPVFNEERTIRRVLDSLVAQPLPGDVEIIVVDDGSTDRTQEILQATWHTRHVGVRHEVNRGKGAA